MGSTRQKLSSCQAVWSEIDTDPPTSEIANQTVKCLADLAQQIDDDGRPKSG